MIAGHRLVMLLETARPSRTTATPRTSTWRIPADAGPAAPLRQAGPGAAGVAGNRPWPVRVQRGWLETGHGLRKGVDAAVQRSACTKLRFAWSASQPRARVRLSSESTRRRRHPVTE